MLSLLIATMVWIPGCPPGLNSPCCPQHWVLSVDGECLNWFNDPTPGVVLPEEHP